ncbi:MAG: hypothetical protein ABIN89_02450, partial [Chitinophagaceae bacterium]
KEEKIILSTSQVFRQPFSHPVSKQERRKKNNARKSAPLGADQQINDLLPAFCSYETTRPNIPNKI